MSTKTIGNWLVDLRNLECRNIETQMVIAFEKRGLALKGRIRDMPDKLLEQWRADPNGERYIRKAVIEADDIFFRAYFDKEIERKSTGAQLTAAFSG